MRRVYTVVNEYGWPVARDMNYSMAADNARSWSIVQPQRVFHVKHPKRRVVASFRNGLELEPGKK